uniref:Uncharacterized protein n=1 Tax=Zea mays TaxID=4577 RepID=B4FH45_MAIZE|nr:unknown [Zea mays]
MAVLLWRCICGPQQSFSKNRGASTPSPLAGRRSKYSGQSVKAMPMRLLTVGKKRSRGTQLLVEEYKEKLGHYCEFEDTLIRSNPKLTRYDPPTLKPVVRYIYNRRPSLQCAYQYVRHQSTAYRLSPAFISHLISLPISNSTL